MLKRFILAAGLALAIVGSAYADMQKFGDETKATAFCKAGNVVWFNPDRKIYFTSESQYYGKNEAGRVHLQGVRGERRLPGHQGELNAPVRADL